MGLVGGFREPVKDGAHEPVPHHDEDADDEEVRGRGEQAPRFSHPAQVAERDASNRENAEHDAVAMQSGHRRRQRRDAGHDRHGDREHVVDQQRRRRHEGW
jgi:hypothetical protein